MGHIPHLFLPAPWQNGAIPLPEATVHHLFRVVRVESDTPVAYTDGDGRRGEGKLEGRSVRRGEESLMPPPAVALHMMVAPPHERERLRFLVEKLAELGVSELSFLHTRYGVARLPDPGKTRTWAISALEQSRGAWLMRTSPSWVEIPATDQHVWFANYGSPPPPAPPIRLGVAVGPEGGWAPAEIPEGALRFGLGPNVLRVETAAVAAATLLLRPP